MGRGEWHLPSHETFELPDTYALIQWGPIAVVFAKPETNTTKDRRKRFLALQVPIGLFIFTSLDKLDPCLYVIACGTAILTPLSS